MKRKKNNHLAEGEVTGHFHLAEGEVEVFENQDDSLMLHAPQGSDITHQEHKTIQLPPGTYRTDRILEYDPASEEVRRVRD